MTTIERRAAQYVRMSTDMQRYSLENQSDAIAVYAAHRGLVIVRSYEDAGRSGLRIEGRDALKRLIEDVTSGQADFATILVYDVSRWGRFQDTDESAYYEFVCRQAGLSIEYCAESFENDGSLTATILKSIKRAMAGEYSRELSKKVFAGQARLAAMGFNVGSPPGFGLRRCLLDEQGRPKMMLTAGQRKNVKSERVIFVRGPGHEVETIQKVYDLFLDQKKSLVDIANVLNAQGILNARNCEWTTMSVRQLLSNEKYIGNCVYNRGSKKLGGKWKRNPRSEWVRASGAFEAIISPEHFRAAQCQLKENSRSLTDNDLLDFLSAIRCREGHLSATIIKASKVAPSDNTFKQHFGSLTNAFHRVGYTNSVVEARQASVELRRSICADILMNVTWLGRSARFISKRQCQLSINEEITATVVLGRTAPVNQSAGYNQWRFGYRSQHKPDFLVVARVDPGALHVRDYFVLPFLFLPPGSWVTVSGKNYLRLEQFRISTLEPFYEICARVQLEMAHS